MYVFTYLTLLLENLYSELFHAVYCMDGSTVSPYLRTNEPPWWGNWVSQFQCLSHRWHHSYYFQNTILAMDGGGGGGGGGVSLHWAYMLPKCRIIMDHFFIENDHASDATLLCLHIHYREVHALCTPAYFVLRVYTCTYMHILLKLCSVLAYYMITA